MSDAFSDIEKWTQEIKEKEKKLVEDPDSVKNKSSKVILMDWIFEFKIIVIEFLFFKGLPPIRNLVTKKKKKKKKEATSDTKKEEEKNKSNKLKLNSYDYRAWDKLDIVYTSFSILKIIMKKIKETI